MPQHQDLKLPAVPMPRYLDGIQPPVSVEEAIEFAARHGASAEILRFMEALPAAVFTSEEGIRNALAAARPGHIPDASPDELSVSEDGTSS